MSLNKNKNLSYISDADVSVPETKLETKKELKKLDWRIIIRLMTFLNYNERTKKTNIAMTCKMGYDKCVLYLNWMEIMDLIEKQFDGGGFELIGLNHRGREIFEKNLKNII